MKNIGALTFGKSLRGAIGSALELLFPLSLPEREFREFPASSRRLLKEQKKNGRQTVGIFFHGQTPVLLKRLRFRFRTLSFFHLRNEAHVLSHIGGMSVVLESSRFRRVFFPRLLSFEEVRGRITIARSFHSGRPVSKDIAFEQEALRVAILSLRAIPDDAVSSFARRPFSLALVTFPIYWGISLVLFPRFFRTLLSFGKLFFLNASQAVFAPSRLVVTHRDLFARNMAVKGETLSVFDFELCVRSNPELEVARIVLEAFPIWGLYSTKRFLDSFSMTPSEKSRCIAFLAFSFVQALLLESSTLSSDRAKGLAEFLEFFSRDTKLLSYSLSKNGF